ncbi:MAG: ankyrin repeat domain-containing protein, partial [Gammaproteobacteria bacterium]|nr:ankyrin repeat domain-containing protein [Gammaproteobacteria bacterium]
GRDHVDIIEALLAAGADINTADQRGVTPLMYAVSEEKINAVQTLLRGNADVSRVDNKGATALDMAEHIGSKPIIAILQ